MKKTLYYSLVLLFISSNSYFAEAQFIKKVQNAANRGIEKALEKKVEDEAAKMTEKQVEKIFSDMYGEDSVTSGGFDMSSIMKGMGEPVDTESEYDFFGFLVMEITSTNEKGKTQDPVQIKSLLAEDSDYTGMEIQDPENPKASTTMIFDVKNQASILLLDNKGEKSSFAYKLDLDGIKDEIDEQIEPEMMDQEMTLEKTGNTKDILGYKCDEYHMKSEDAEGYYWMTEEPIGGYNSFWGTNSPMTTAKTKENYAKYFKDLPKGNFMEMIYTSDEDGTVEMKVIEIDESAQKTFLMTEYPNIMNSLGQN